MPALFPGSVRIFTPKVDLVDTVMASHVNLLQDEMTAVQTTLGTGILSSSWSGSYSNPSTHASVAARLSNIESGVKDTATALSSVSGSVVGTANTQTLTNKTLVGPVITISRVSRSTSHTLELTDASQIIEVGSASATTVTIPTDAAVALPVGTQIAVLQTGSGQVTLAPAGGVTVNGTPGLKLRTQWSVATLIKRASNTWVVFGDTVA